MNLSGLAPKDVELNSECACRFQKSKKSHVILRRRGFMAKKRLIFSFLILEPCHNTSQHYGYIFPILFELENKKNIVKNAGTGWNKVKNVFEPSHIDNCRVMPYSLWFLTPQAFWFWLKRRKIEF